MTKAREPTTVMGIYKRGMAMPTLAPYVYSASSLVAPFNESRKGTASATRELSTLDEARTMVTGALERRSGFKTGRGSASRPFLQK